MFFTMKLVFHGTRGYIEPQTDRHARHSVLEVQYRGKGVVIDCGEDWLDHLEALRPQAIVVTHAHPDHAGGLAAGVTCPVYATEEAWEDLAEYPLAERRTVVPRQPFEVRGITFEAFTVEHSLRAPAVGYRITAGQVSVFYVPDLVYIHERAVALQGARVYIGDGATVDQEMVRRQDDRLFGHTPVRTQLTWCAKEGVPKMIVSHCGSQIVEGEEEDILEVIEGYAAERGVAVEVAYDGMEIVLR